MLSDATNQPRSTVDFGYMCPRGLSGSVCVFSSADNYTMVKLPDIRLSDIEKSLYLLS